MNNQILIIFEASALIYDLMQSYHVITKLSYLFSNKILIEKELALRFRKHYLNNHTGINAN